MRIEKLKELRNENELKCNILQLTRLVLFSRSSSVLIVFCLSFFFLAFHPKKIIYILSRISLCVLTFKIVVVFGVAFRFSLGVFFFLQLLVRRKVDVNSCRHTHIQAIHLLFAEPIPQTHISLVYLHKACSAEALFLSISPSSNAARHTKPYNSIMKQQSKQFEWQSLFFSVFQCLQLG